MDLFWDQATKWGAVYVKGVSGRSILAIRENLCLCLFSIIFPTQRAAYRADTFGVLFGSYSTRSCRESYWRAF